MRDVGAHCSDAAVVGEVTFNGDGGLMNYDISAVDNNYDNSGIT